MKYFSPLATLLLSVFILNCSVPERSASVAAAPNAQSSQAFGKAALTAANRSPLYVSSDQGSTWKAVVSNLPEDTQVSFMEMMGAHMLIATDNRGLFIGNQSFTHFEMISEALPSQKINALHLDGENIYVGVYREGLYGSEDLGQNWQSLNHDLPNLRVQAIKHYNGKLVVGTDAGIYQFDKKLSKWENLYPDIQVLSLESLQGAWIAGTNRGTLKSTNQGKDWQWIHEMGAVHYTHIVDEQIAEFVLMEDVYFSADLGQSWTKANLNPKESSYVYEVIKSGNSLVLSNNYGIHRSTDGGKNWQLVHATEEMGFFDLYARGNLIYGGTRVWDEFRGR
ncbi:MAG: hypothetical protein AAF927_32640 [Bacteroidota bacterium]